MTTAILSDLSRVFLFPKDEPHNGSLNKLHADLLKKYGHYNFFDYFILNEELLNLYAALKSKYSINMFATGVVQNVPEIREKIDPIFDNIYSAKEYHLDKKDPSSYILLAQKLNKKPRELLYIDDQLENCKAAKKAGLNALLYKDYAKLLNELKEYIELPSKRDQNSG